MLIKNSSMRNSALDQATKKNDQKISFKANKSIMNLIKESDNRHDKRMDVKFLAKFYDKFGDDCEKFSDFLNMAGKIFIAPLTIIFNPFVKKDQNDKDERFYAAMKHPIEGILMGIMQIGIAMGVDNYIESLASKGKLGKKMNLNNIPKESGKYHKHALRASTFAGLVSAGTVLVLTPLLAKVSNYIYPKIMNLFYQNTDNNRDFIKHRHDYSHKNCVKNDNSVAS